MRKIQPSQTAREGDAQTDWSSVYISFFSDESAEWAEQ